MYFYKLLEEERDLKVRIEFIEGTINLLKNGYNPNVSGLHLAYNNLEDAYIGLSEVKKMLKEVQDRMRKFILGK